MPHGLTLGAIAITAALTPAMPGIRTGQHLRAYAPRNLRWHGGPVQRHPRVYIIFWGPKWSTDPAHRGVRGVVVRTIAALRGSSYQQLLTQYYDRAGHVTGDVRLAGVWRDRRVPRGHFTAGKHDVARAAREIAHVAAVRRLPNSLDTQYLLLVQSSEPTGYCGDDVNRELGGRPLIFSIIPWLGPRGAGCTTGNSLGEGYGSTVSHEYAEMVTDPLANGWARGNPAGHNYEIADLCNADARVDGVWMQKVWSNRLHRCAA